MSERSDGAPDRIWLQLHGDEEPPFERVDCRADEVTWCWEPIFDHDVEYTRSDLAAERGLKDKLQMIHSFAFDDGAHDMSEHERLERIREIAYSGFCDEALATHEHNEGEA